jgi:DNA-binding HxlR family transcriptional regulator
MSRGGYGQYCGLARALDLVGGRWALLVVRDLLTGPKRFGELQEGLPGIPTNVLTARLRELEDAGVVERKAQARPGGGVVYALTESGRDLEPAVMSLGFWGARTLAAPQADDYISIDSLALALRGAFRPAHARGPHRLYELRLNGKSLRLSVKNGKLTVPDPSADAPDLVLDTDAGVFTALLVGTLDIDSAIESGQADIDGRIDDARRLFEMLRVPSA